MLSLQNYWLHFCLPFYKDLNRSMAENATFWSPRLLLFFLLLYTFLVHYCSISKRMVIWVFVLSSTAFSFGSQYSGSFGYALCEL